MSGSLRRGVLPGLVVAGVVVALRVAEVGGKLGSSSLAGAQTVAGEVQRWLGWQLWDNVRAGRAPLDASVFPSATGSIWDLVGNPGVALLIAPFHALGSPNFAHSLGMFALLAAACVAGGVYGGVRGVPWIGALAAGAAWWSTGLAGGLAVQAWIAPGAAAAAAAVVGKRGWALAFTLLGAATAPLPTAALLAGGGAWPLAGLAALGLLAAPFGTTAPLLSLHAVPLAAWFAIVFVWRERGGARFLAVLAAAGLLLAVVPSPVAGFRLPEVLGSGWGPGAIVAIAMLFGAALGPVARRLTQHGKIAVGLLCFVDVMAPMGIGGGEYWGPPSPPPAVLVALAGAPRSAVVTVLPEPANPAAGVGWIPVHRQFSTRAPSLGGAAAGPDTQPADVATTLRSATTPVVLVLTNAGAADVSAFASALGVPDALDAQTQVWTWP